MLIPRRKFFSSVAGVGILTAASRFPLAEAQTERTTRAMPIPRTKDIRVIECEPQGVRLTVVKNHHRPGRPLRLRPCHPHAARRPASGAEFEEVVENARKLMAQGFRNVRAQVGLPGMAGYGSQHKDQGSPQALHDKPLFDRTAQLTNLVQFQTGVWNLMN